VYPFVAVIRIYCDYSLEGVVLIRKNIATFLASAILAATGCESVNPAGTAQYENPEYPSEQKGFFYCGQDPFSMAFAPGTTVLWISDPSNGRLFYRDVSKALVNPLYADTLVLPFTPGIIAAPHSGPVLYLTEKSTGNLYGLNTQTLVYQRLYTAQASIFVMELSHDGSVLYMGSQGAPWGVEAASTVSWDQMAFFPLDWPVNRLAVASDGSRIAAGNSGRMEITLHAHQSLALLDTLHMPMRTGAMSFTMDSGSLVVLDASSMRPYMVKLNLETGEFDSVSRPYNAYQTCVRIPGTNTLLLPRRSEARVSVLNMDNMIFAPSLPVDNRVRQVCVTADGAYIAMLSSTSTPGRATVFH
jgi:hypothetical protein